MGCGGGGGGGLLGFKPFKPSYISSISAQSRNPNPEPRIRHVPKSLLCDVAGENTYSGKINKGGEPSGRGGGDEKREVGEGIGR